MSASGRCLPESRPEAERFTPVSRCTAEPVEGGIDAQKAANCLRGYPTQAKTTTADPSAMLGNHSLAPLVAAPADPVARLVNGTSMAVAARESSEPRFCWDIVIDVEWGFVIACDLPS